MVAFKWNGTRLWGRPGDTIAVALLRNGIVAFAASRKRRRPLGLSGSFIQGVLARVDGVPNVRLDQTPLAAGMDVVAQGGWPGPRLDLTRALRAIPARRVRGGFEHPRWLPGGTRRFERFEQVMSVLAGGGALAPHMPPHAVVPGRRRQADVVVIGGGVAGIAAANAARAEGRTVVLIAREALLGGMVRRLGETVPSLADGVEVLTRHEAFGVYRAGQLIAAAPDAPDLPATAIAAGRLVIATGRRSCPPLVPGNDLPGVMEASVALDLALAHGLDLGRIVIVGTGAETRVAARLRTAGAAIACCAPVARLERIVGSQVVRAADIGSRRIACDTLVHAGPWIADPNLPFQAAAGGALRLVAGALPDTVSLAGGAALPDEPPHVGALDEIAAASVCPCMDVTAAEILDLIAGGMEHVEELKRQTSCGMGPCQGFPCWELLRGLMRRASGGRLGDDRPSHRDPRRAVTVAQAAGLADLVEPQR